MISFFRNKWVLAVFVVLATGSLFLLYFPERAPEKPTRTSHSAPAITFQKHGTFTFNQPNGSPLKSIDIEIADTDRTRAQGLMYRTQLPDTQGMLFIFDYEMPQSFWMKNTPASLDMIFINSRYEIVGIQEYTQPYSTQSYPSEKPAIYVLEVRAGFCDDYGINTGMTVSFQRDPR